MDIQNLKLSETCQIPLLKQYYEMYLPDKGVFVEIGAFDGDSFSNTSGLADKGWEGHYVEASPAFASQCLLRHKENNVKVYNYAISDQEEILKLHIGGPLSTISLETKDAYKEIDWAKNVKFQEEIQISAVRLDKFLTSSEIKRKFDLLVIDVEGYEEKVFNSFDLKFWNPRMIIVELIDYHYSFNSSPKLQYSSKKVRDLIIASGYKQIYADEINSIFLDNFTLEK
jgi:FkbM family methyltransferase